MSKKYLFAPSNIDNNKEENKYKELRLESDIEIVNKPSNLVFDYFVQQT